MTRLSYFTAALVAALPAALICVDQARAVDPPATAPSGRAWNYVYDGASAAADSAAALDGNWNHDNGSDQWDGSAIGGTLGDDNRPGGAMTLGVGSDAYLRLQDTGDPRDYGFDDDGSNRKIYFGRDIGADGAPGNVLNDAELAFRIRLASDGPLDEHYVDGGGGIEPWPAGGMGYDLHDGLKGMIGIHQADGGIISMGILDAGDRDGPSIALNNVAGDDFQLLPLPSGVSLTDWIEFEVGITAGGAGTHQLDVSINGSPAGVFDVGVGDGVDYDGFSYIAMGVGSTGRAGAFDVDYFAVSYAAIPEPATLALLGLGLAGLTAGRRRIG